MPEEVPSIELDRDGRTLACAEYGTADGRPVLFFHGTPGSRRSAGLLDAAAAGAGVRLIAPDRPGVGRSDPRPDRTIRDWADDVAALVAALGLDRFGVVGYSAGGPHALACAVDDRLAGRIDAVGLLGGAAPPAAPRKGGGVADRALDAAARTAPWLLGPAFRLQAWLIGRRPPAAAVGLFSDRPVGTGEGEIDPAVAEAVKRDLVGAVARGHDGVVRDVVLLARPWPFDPADVAVPVVCRYGGGDVNSPPAHGRYLAERLPEADLTVVPGVDHLGLLADEGGALLETVVD